MSCLIALGGMLDPNAYEKYNKKPYHRHLRISKLFPKVFDCVQANQSRDEEADHLDAASGQIVYGGIKKRKNT